MLNTIYTLKACLLFMYQRITQGTPQQRLVKYLAIYVAVGWVATEIAFFTSCRPFNGYWAVPPPNPECTTLRRYAYVQAAFNLTSDVCMILIPVPMVLRLRLPLKQKIILAGVFSMGTFVVSAQAFATLGAGFDRIRHHRSLQPSSQSTSTSATSGIHPTCCGTHAKPPSRSGCPTSR